jgi:hypothetical protein
MADNNPATRSANVLYLQTPSLEHATRMLTAPGWRLVIVGMNQDEIDKGADQPGRDHQPGSLRSLALEGNLPGRQIPGDHSSRRIAI